MMRLRLASVIATLPVLSWAAPASAECAWVFWLEAGDARTHESSSRPVSTLLLTGAPANHLPPTSRPPHEPDLKIRRTRCAMPEVG